ncbi:ATP-binding protein [Geomonas sp. RF6]|uniref:ATP-binding protein n=1 Tax=Geomonas sp. RF6 TaxID=2897342 RepID=UPI001E5C4CF4|nr:ATP-binding protein [Geomonas sp. RF6]UFS71388.1 ATP-binding protein [Geomonas sp. RF6]
MAWPARQQGKGWSDLLEEATISPVYDFEGEIVNFVAVKRDITDYLRIQNEKEKLQEQFNQAQKMESIGRLAGGVAHDLNNMLVPIFGYSDLLLRHLDSGEKPAAYVHNIMDACNRARDIVKQLLAFSRKQPLEFRKVNLNDVVANFIKLLRRTIREDITIELKPAATPLVIEADVGQIEQVILNLLVNAQDAMPRGGRLIIESWRAELDEMEAAIHQDVTPGLYCVLALSDTGCGMDQDTQRRIFEPFFTTKEAGKGTGLGLASVYGIVRQHSGSILVYSEPRRGTTFKVYLPCAGETAVEAAESGSTEIVGGTEVILLVEDDEIVRSLTETVLGSLGYTVLVAEDGKKALKLLEEHGGEVQLLLTDVVMPHMSANDLYCFVQSRFPETRILYMSGYTSDVVAETGLLEKGIHFIQKPFSVKALANKVREVIDDTARSRLGWSCDDGGGERGESRPE